MSVQIIINGENAAESLKELSTLAAGIGGGSAPAAQQSEEAPSKRQNRKAAESTKPAEDKTEKQELAVETEASQEQGDDGQEDDGAEIPTDVQLRAAASAAAAKEGGKVKVKGLLTKYEVPNITAVPDEKRIAFLRELEAI